MKKWIALAFVLSFLAGLVLIPEADAGGCRRVAAAKAVVVQQQAVVTTPVLAALVTAQPVYPLFGVGYGYGSDGASAAELKLLRQELKQLRQDLAAPAPQQPAPPAAMPREGAAPAKAAADLLAAVKTSCARCHGAAAPKGGLSLVTAGGELADVPQILRLKSFRRVALGEMPPGGPAVDDAALELFAKWSE